MSCLAGSLIPDVKLTWGDEGPLFRYRVFCHGDDDVPDVKITVLKSILKSSHRPEAEGICGLLNQVMEEVL